ncbi:calpain-A-like isoform X1 [Eriocheir sinensis]|uniref:calpain-A-like isoform X1 n=1 Tax=Eriocheir sinensis TaxID=95602 RepID=UPI0021C893F3|nr:calpain-A-like isoform X1 [Eriocheir sinensis]XP_050700586.1 calpain-A-like isoform X1 [Eriocheir sinensis]XP_050700587.1 calpain-A-like isoform X1 [Eriocheir sinensis]XP_050700588.1 calpain-A-like isoform X1 [Eriocheir sinensis]
MSGQEVVEEPCVFQPQHQHDDRHCRCYKGGDDKPVLLDNIEPVTLQKQTYYSRVTNEYTRQRLVRATDRPVKKGFQVLRQEALASGKLYRDPEFPANDYSINFSGVTRRTYEWKRPMELVQNPQFFIDGATRFDIQQGELGDCWLLAAVSNLTLHPQLFHVVVPRDQGFTHLYAGIFHFKFWQYGRWQEVVVDDLLPSHHGRLVFMHSRTPNEFWCALLEKAYAKLYGGYEALRGGNINESMVDLTGGVVELIDLRTPPSNLFPRLLKACRRGALIGCAIEPDHPGVRPETIMANGLIVRHAYSITRVTAISLGAAPKLKEQRLISPVHRPHLHGAMRSMVKYLGGVASGSSISSKIKSSSTHLSHILAPLTNWNLGLAFPEGEAHLLRLHNPWGNEAEWQGSWSDKSPEWNAVPPGERQRLGLTFNDDGEFWMNFQDFINNFTTVEICDVSPEFYAGEENGNGGVPEDVERGWRVTMYEGAWVANHSAGGCRNYINTFARNPQYTIQLKDPDEEDDDDLCTVIISLMQKNVRQMKRYGKDYVPIGFTLYKLPPSRPPGLKLDVDFFRYNASCGKVPFFLNTREVTTRFRMPAGHYVIIPSTFEPEMTGEFLLRVFTEIRQ